MGQGTKRPGDQGTMGPGDQGIKGPGFPRTDKNTKKQQNKFLETPPCRRARARAGALGRRVIQQKVRRTFSGLVLIAILSFPCAMAVADPEVPELIYNDGDDPSQGLVCCYGGCDFRGFSWHSIFSHVRLRHGRKYASLRSTYLYKKGTEEPNAMQNERRRKRRLPDPAVQGEP